MDEATSANGRPVVLVVDDDFDIREALQEVLHDAGYLVSHAADGSEAWTYLRQNPAPALILLDLFMPIMTGRELLKLLQSTDSLRSIPTVLMTASPNAQVDSGVPLLQKPMSVGKLLDLLEKLAPVHATQLAGTRS